MHVFQSEKVTGKYTGIHKCRDINEMKFFERKNKIVSGRKKGI